MFWIKPCFLIATFCCSIAFAQSTEHIVRDTTKLVETTVYGYTKVSQLNRQAYNVSVIDTRQLRNTTQDIAHVLDRIPGARLRETGGVGSDFDLSINGFSGKRIRFYLDGVPMDNFGPAFQINNIPINTVERVEVYRGVIPVWLGGDALGGAVNIVSNQEISDYLDASYSFGSFNTHRTNIGVAKTGKKGFTVRLNAFQNYSDNNYKVRVDAADIHSGKYTADTTVRRYHDTYHNETAIVQLGFVKQTWADQFLLGITTGQYYKEIQTGARMTAVFGAWHTKGNIIMPTLKYQKKNVVKGLDVSVNANYNFGREQSIDTVHARFGWLADSITLRGKGGEQWYSYYQYRNNMANTTITASYKINDRQTLAFNHTYSHFSRKGRNRVSENGRLDSIPRKADKNFLGLSYQYMLADRWNATVFGKYLTQKAYTTRVETDIFNGGDTIYTDEDAHRKQWGYGMAASYFIKPEFQVKLSYEKTNRLPEAEDLFGDVLNKEGNWDIKPETSNNINLGLNYATPIHHHRLAVNVTGIYYYAKNFIYDVFNSNTNKLYADNLLDVSNLGIETDILFTNSTLASGVLATENTGIEQDGSTRNYIVNNGYFMSLLFAQSSPGPITTYQFDATKKLVSLGTFQTETMTAYGNVGEEVLLFKNAWQPAEEYTQWYRLDPKTRQIVGSGEIDAHKLAGNGGKAFFTDIKKVGDKVFAPFWSIESGQNFRQAYPDSTWIAVYSYPDMKLEKVIRDGRTGSIGAYFTSGIDIDENGDTYVFGTKLGYDSSAKYSTKTPVAVMKIKKGTTEYDKSFFLNLTDVSGGQYVYKKTYMGKGYFLLTMVPQPYVYGTIFYGALIYGGIKFAIVNVYDGSFKWVTGTPDNKSIQSTTGQDNYSDLDGSAYVGIYYTEGEVGKSTVYKIDGVTGKATAGLSTDGKAAITGIYKVPVNN